MFPLESEHEGRTVASSLAGQPTPKPSRLPAFLRIRSRGEKRPQDRQARLEFLPRSGDREPCEGRERNFCFGGPKQKFISSESERIPERLGARWRGFRTARVAPARIRTGRGALADSERLASRGFRTARVARIPNGSRGADSERLASRRRGSGGLGSRQRGSERLAWRRRG
jgi:hypothetical protein